MKKFLEKQKMLDIPMLAIAFALWSVWQVSGLSATFFQQPGDDVKILRWVKIYRLLQLIFFYVILELLHAVWKRRAERNVRRAAQLSVVYFAVTFLLLLLMWPGTYYWDDVAMLLNEHRNILLAWQHYFSSLWHIICLETLPFVSGVQIIQCFVAAIAMGYSAVKVTAMFFGEKPEKTRRIVETVLLIVGFLPPVVLQLLGGFRMATYIYAELLLAVWLCALWKLNTPQRFIDWLRISLLVALVAAWRSEAIYYIVCFPILLLVIYIHKKKWPSPFACGAVILAAVLTVAIGKENTKLIETHSYSAMAAIQPLQAIVLNADTSEDEELLKTIDKVVVIDVYREHPDMTPEALYWEKGLIRGYGSYTDDEYSAFIKAYAQLLIRHPVEAFKPMWELFLQSCGIMITDEGKTLQRITTPVTASVNTGCWEQLDVAGKEKLNEVVFDKTMRILLCMDSENVVQPLYFVFWNLLIPLALLLVCLLFYAGKKDLYMVFLMLTLLGRVPLIMATNTAPYIMYYLPVYMGGYFWGTICLAQILMSLNGKRSVQGQKT